MIADQPRPHAQLTSRRRRAARTIAAGVAIGGGHLALLLILSANLPKAAPGPWVEPAPADFVVRVERPRPPTPAPLPRRNGAPAPPPRPESARPAPEPPQPASAQAPPQTAASQPNYGRWTVAPGTAPGAAPAQVPALAGCTPSTLPSLAGAAHDACARRLTELATSAPALPPAGGPRNARDQAYAEAVRAWKASPDMTSHPCPPQDEPAGKLYLDKCSLVNAARRVSRPFGHSQAAVKVEFKIRF